MILVTGANGITGRKIIKALLSKNLKVRAFDLATQSESLKSLGVHEVCSGDLLDQDSIKQAMNGVKGIYHIPPAIHSKESLIGKTVVNAACESNIEHFVLHSVLHPQISAMPHHAAKLKTEECLIESGLPFTIMQPTVYMQNWQQRVKKGKLLIPWNLHTNMTMLDVEDLAEAVAIVFSEKERHFGATYELCGENLSIIKVAQIMSEELGETIIAEQLPIDIWKERVRKFLGENEIETLTKMNEHYNSRGLIGNTNVLNWLLGRSPGTYAEVVRREMKS